MMVYVLVGVACRLLPKIPVAQVVPYTITRPSKSASWFLMRVSC